MQDSARWVFWDFDGTLVPFDSEQFLLESLFVKASKRPFFRSLGARLFVYGDRQGWHPGMLKVLYGWCLRGVPLAVLGGICERIATHISTADRAAIRSLAEDGFRMAVLSCGTGDLSQRTLRAAGLEDCFVRFEANWFATRDGQITGIERRIYLPETKVDIAAQCSGGLERAIAVGDGLTDLPLLDRVGVPVLIATGSRASQLDHRGYHIVDSLAKAITVVGQAAPPRRPRPASDHPG